MLGQALIDRGLDEEDARVVAAEAQRTRVPAHEGTALDVLAAQLAPDELEVGRR